MDKKERQAQSEGAYELSNYLKYFLRNMAIKNIDADGLSILIVDDVKTTGSTLIECMKTIENYISLFYYKKINVEGMTISYEA